MTTPFDRWLTTDPRDAAPECPTCEGTACEYGCGRCEAAYDGPDSHRVCRTCRGSGVQPEPPEVVCRTCSGSTWVLATVPDGRTIEADCPDCTES